MERILAIFADFSLLDAVDVLIVSIAISSLIMMIRNTRAIQLVKGLLYVLLAFAVSSFLELKAIGWLMDKILTLGIVAIPIVFQSELRKVLEELGRGTFFHKQTADQIQINQMFTEIIKAVDTMSAAKTGALIVLERKTGLREYMETGVELDSLVTSQLLLNIFYKNTPLHDGAVMIRNNRIVAAACYLPLSANPEIAQELGTRHRAGIGITEQSDCLTIIVSEETGAVSLAKAGKLIRYLDGKMLGELLQQTYFEAENTLQAALPAWLRWGGKKDE
ncbi:MAG: diadenylate cyclase CdaA [Negativicutes bacterium]|nr:diadenylate cyclase CdaA [Negativicutes bacterium]